MKRTVEQSVFLHSICVKHYLLWRQYKHVLREMLFISAMLHNNIQNGGKIS